jgi:magnesium transporter
MGGMEVLDGSYLDTGFATVIEKSAGWLVILFSGEVLTATAIGHFEHEIERAVVLSLFIPLLISGGGNSALQATSLIIHALALEEIRLRDWWRVISREVAAGVMLGAILGVVGFTRIMIWQSIWHAYGQHYF